MIVFQVISKRKAPAEAATKEKKSEPLETMTEIAAPLAEVSGQPPGILSLFFCDCRNTSMAEVFVYLISAHGIAEPERDVIQLDAPLRSLSPSASKPKAEPAKGKSKYFFLSLSHVLSADILLII